MVRSWMRQNHQKSANFKIENKYYIVKEIASSYHKLFGEVVLNQQQQKLEEKYFSFLAFLIFKVGMFLRFFSRVKIGKNNQTLKKEKNVL